MTSHLILDGHHIQEAPKGWSLQVWRGKRSGEQPVGIPFSLSSPL